MLYKVSLFGVQCKNLPKCFYLQLEMELFLVDIILKVVVYRAVKKLGILYKISFSINIKSNQFHVII